MERERTDNKKMKTKYPYNKWKLDNRIKQHKILARKIADKEYTQENNQKAIDKYIMSGEEIALILSEFKCEIKSCEDKDITLHHLVTRENKHKIPYNKYIVSRHYFFSICVMCPKHHNIVQPQSEKREILSEKTINKIKKEFEFKNVH